MEKIPQYLVNNPLVPRHVWRTAEWDDILAVVLLALTAAILVFDSSFFSKDPLQHLWYQHPQGVNLQQKSTTDINIAQQLKDQGKEIVIFYGTQSGTSHELARNLSHMIFQRFSKAAIVADLSEYDYDTLTDVPPNVIVLFILSTYGEGDPPDNATKFDEWLDKGSQKSLANLHFAILGLGNRNYKHYNHFAKKAQQVLESAGGSPITALSLADDSTGLTRGDFSEWATQLQKVFVDRCQMPEQPRPYESTLDITPSDPLGDSESITRPTVNPQSASKLKGPTSTIYSAAIASMTNLTPRAQRTTLHIEIDTSHLPRFKYSVGDHLLIWPENSAHEIQQLRQILRMDDAEMHRPLEIRSKDPETKVFWPQPVTIHALFKHHLDIAGLASRDLILALREFAPSQESKAMLDQMALNYRHLSTMRPLNLASILLQASSSIPTWNLPLPFLLDHVNPLKPRYYSIASAPAVSPRKIALTVAMREIRLGDKPPAPGLASGFFLQAQQQLLTSKLPESEKDPVPPNVWCTLRKSKFKPPASNMHPIIMVANGSGIAPFLGFLHHRLRKLEIEGGVGQMALFYGCRDETSHLYKDELERVHSAFGGQLRLVTAYSRTSGAGYVQDFVRAHGTAIEALLCEGQANVYICGSVNMAFSVRQELLRIFKNRRNWTDAQAQDFEGAQLRMRKWQLDVWG
ncbi:hypothetical protein FE257_002562 [Aspergillus nanangensis]|uniref:NADPH--cytochrome P450 reductase n=1 Tax=Aspergillus nanangensis TaxID=2582783 RepID=A0AAD4CT01_ASPNN|nr:hypothetical protein FE257_002562 [Aspergillus nanangensis]